MVRIALIALIQVVFLQLNAQELYIRQGLIKASATISPGKMLNRPTSTIYLSGFAEYHVEKNVSLRGETFWYVDGESANANPDLHFDRASRTYFGVFYHLNKRNWDNYLGFQPGISIIKPQFAGRTEVVPSFAITLGTSYFVWKFFHFFANVSYLNSSLRDFSDGTRKADELVLSAGLGFQVNTKKK